MRGPGDDKIVIARNQDNGHWIYFSVRDDHDNGTIIDFLQHRKRLSLGAIRKTLRPWIGQGTLPPIRPPRETYAAQIEAASKDLAQAATAYARMQPLNGRHPWLEAARGIPAAVLADPRFADKIRSDARGNAVFPHYNASGLCGYELKNAGFTGFAKGGEKGIWTSAASSADTTLVIVEGAIDALSYHALRRPAHTRYISSGGHLNPGQPALIQAAMARLPAGGKVIIATDNDEGGDSLAEQLQALAAEIKPLEGVVVLDRPPGRGADWNDVLRAAMAPPDPLSVPTLP